MSVPSWAEFSPLHVTVDWMHGPRRLTRKVPLHYKPFMGRKDLSIREEFGSHPVRFRLPPSALEGLEYFYMGGKRFARMPSTECSGLRPLIRGLHERISELLNGQLARYTDRLRLIYHPSYGKHGTGSFSCRAPEGKGDGTTLRLDNAIVIDGRRLHLPFTLV